MHSVSVRATRARVKSRVRDPRTTAVAKINLILANNRAKENALFISIVSVRGRGACSPSVYRAPYNTYISSYLRPTQPTRLCRRLRRLKLKPQHISRQFRKFYPDQVNFLCVGAVFVGVLFVFDLL